MALVQLGAINARQEPPSSLTARRAACSRSPGALVCVCAQQIKSPSGSCGRPPAISSFHLQELDTDAFLSHPEGSFHCNYIIGFLASVPTCRLQVLLKSPCYSSLGVGSVRFPQLLEDGQGACDLRFSDGHSGRLSSTCPGASFHRKKRVPDAAEESRGSGDASERGRVGGAGSLQANEGDRSAQPH